jgi:DNA-binding beta-propeller fold protein YncE
MLPLLLALSLSADPRIPKPEPRIVVGHPLPDGAVKRFGDTHFTFAGFAPQLRALFYAPDGKRVAVNTNTGVYVWEAATGKRLLWVPSEEGALSTFVGFGTGTEVVVACAHKWDDMLQTAFRVDHATGKVTAKFDPGKVRHRFGGCSPDGKVLFSRLWDGTDRSTVATAFATGKELWRTKPNSSDDWMQLSPDGSRLLNWSARAKWECKVIDTETGKEVGRFSHEEDAPTWTNGGVAIAPKAERVAAAHAWNRGFSVWDVGTEKVRFWQKGQWHDDVFFLPGGKELVALRWRNAQTIETWGTTTQKLVASVKSELDGTSALSPDGKTLALVGSRGRWNSVQFVDVATGKRKAPSPDVEVFEDVWFADANTISVAAPARKQARQWDVKSGETRALPAATVPPPAMKWPNGFRPARGTTNVVFAPNAARAVAYRHDPDETDGIPGDHWYALLDADGEIVLKFDWPEHGARAAFAPDGKTFALARRRHHHLLRCGEGQAVRPGAPRRVAPDRAGVLAGRYATGDDRRRIAAHPVGGSEEEVRAPRYHNTVRTTRREL